MSAPVEIPTNFVIPEGYSHQWMIVGKKGSVRIMASGGKLTMEESGRFDKQESSECLDWIAMTVERIRMAAEQEIGGRKCT